MLQDTTGTFELWAHLGTAGTEYAPRAQRRHTRAPQGTHPPHGRVAGLVLAMLLGAVSSALAQERRFYIYRDVDAPTNHGAWSNWMPAEAAKMITLNLADPTDPASGSTAVRVDVAFQRPGWCGIAVASAPNCWGDTPCQPTYDLRGATKLVFAARGAQGGETIQVKMAITGDKPHGDSSRLPIASPWIKLTKTWQMYEVPINQQYDLTRVLTPFVFVTNQQQNQASTITFYLDDISFVMGDGQ